MEGRLPGFPVTVKGLFADVGQDWASLLSVLYTTFTRTKVTVLYVMLFESVLKCKKKQKCF